MKESILSQAIAEGARLRSEAEGEKENMSRITQLMAEGLTYELRQAPKGYTLQTILGFERPPKNPAYHLKPDIRPIPKLYTLHPSGNSHSFKRKA